MCHLYPYNNVKLLRKFFNINFCINCIIVFLGRMLVLFISLFVLALVVLTYIAQLYVLCPS